MRENYFNLGQFENGILINLHMLPSLKPAGHRYAAIYINCKLLCELKIVH